MLEPVLDLDEALDSELVREREMVVELDQPEHRAGRQLGVPVKLSRTPAARTRPAPALGEHTREVLAAAGFSDEEIAALLESGAVGRPGREHERRSWADGMAAQPDNGLLQDQRAGRGSRGAASRRCSHYLREGLLAGAGQDAPQHGLLPAGVRRADPADQAAPGGALHAAEGDPRAARLGNDDPARLRALIELEDRILERARGGRARA